MCSLSTAAQRVKFEPDESICISLTTKSVALLLCGLLILPLLLPFVCSWYFFLTQQNKLWLRELLIQCPLLHCLPPPTPAALQHSFPTPLLCAWQGETKIWISTVLQARTMCLVQLPPQRSPAKGSVSQAPTLPQKPPPVQDLHMCAPVMMLLHGMPASPIPNPDTCSLSWSICPRQSSVSILIPAGSGMHSTASH